MEKEKDDTNSSLDKFSKSFTSVNELINPLMISLKTIRSLPSEESATEYMSGISRARLHITLCYTINSLFCMYLRTQGINPATHPVVDDIVRVQDAFLRLRKVEAGKESTIHAPHPQRNIKEQLDKLRVDELKLSNAVYPEELQLFHALNNRLHVQNKKFHDDDGDGKEDSGSEREGDKENEGEQEEVDKVDKKNKKKKRKRKAEESEPSKDDDKNSLSKRKKKKRKKTSI